MATEVKAILEGKWTVDRSENFEAFLGKTDIGMIKKKIVLTVNPTMVIKVVGETLTVSHSIGPISVTRSFKLGEEYEINDDKPSKAVSTWSEGRLLTIMTPNNPKFKPTTFIREVINGEMVQTMTLDGISCKRYFKKS